MKISLLSIAFLLSFHTYSQTYQEEDLIGFWRKSKTTFKNPADGELFPCANVFPVTFLCFKKGHTLSSAGYSITNSNYNLSFVRSIWELRSKQKRLKMAAPETPENYNLLPIKTFKTGKKLVLTHPLRLRDEPSEEDENMTISLDKSKIELLLTYKRCSKEEALNVSLVDDLYILNREVAKVEWREYAYDLELKDEIIFFNDVVHDETIARQFDPVLNITQEDARAFCEWKAKQIKSYYDLNVMVRLPTKEEWEQLSPSIKNGSQYLMQDIFIEPDWDSFYLKKPVKLLEDIYEWCAEEGFVYSSKSGVEPVSAASTTKTGFRYIIEFL